MESKRHAINLLWDCIGPQARKELADTTSVDQLHSFYSSLTLDNKVEFFSYKPRAFLDDFWPKRERIKMSVSAEKKDDEVEEEVEEEELRKRIERSELLHHQYFNLKKEATADLLKNDEGELDSLQQASKTLPKLQILVEETHRDL